MRISLDADLGCILTVDKITISFPSAVKLFSHLRRMAPENKNTFLGLYRVYRATINSFDGFRSAWKDEKAFQQELVIAVILTPIAFLLPITMIIRLMLVVSMVAVLVVEFLNTAVESVVDMVTKEHHELAKKAKDCGSAAVLLSILNSMILWIYALYLAFFK